MSNEGYSFDGHIDELVVWNTTLKPEQVKLLYQNRTDIIHSDMTEINDTWLVKVTPTDGIEEPITFIRPDTNWVKLKRGDTLQYEVRYTTDRRIDSTTCKYNISKRSCILTSL